MPPAYVKDLGAANSKSSSTTLATTVLGAAALGNCVLVAVGGLTQSTDIASCADSRGNTYTRLGGVSYDLGVGRSAIFASILTTALQIGDTITATWASAVSTRVMAVIEASGITSLTLDGSTPITVEAGADSNMSNGPTATTTNADDFLWAMWLVSNGTNLFDLTPTGSWTESQLATTGIAGTNRSIGTQYRVVSSTGAYTATATQDASRAYDGVLVALPGASSGTTVVVPDPATVTVSALAPAQQIDSTIVVPSPAGVTASALAPVVGASVDNTIVVPAPASATVGASAPDVVITTPPPLPVLPTWRFILANSIDLSPITELALATNRNLKVVLNRPGSVSFDLALDAPGASDIVTIKTCVLAYQYDPASSPAFVLRWSGPVWTISEDLAGNKMSVACVGWYELLNHRYLVADNAPNASTAGMTNSTFESGTTGWAGLTGGTTVATIAQSAVSPHSGTYSLSVFNPNDAPWNFFGTTTGTMENWQIYRLTFWVRAEVAFSATFGSPPLYVQIGAFNPTPNAAFLAAWEISTTWTSYSLEYTHIGATLQPATSYADWQSNPATKFGVRFSCALLPDWPPIFFDDVVLTRVGAHQNGYRFYDNIAADDIAYNLLLTLNEENLSESLPVAIGTSTGAAPPNNNPPRIRTYKRYTNVGQAIQELSDIENGFDFEVDPATRELDLWHQQVGTSAIYGKGEMRPEVRFGYLANPDNLVSFARQIDGQIVSNDTFTLGRFGAGRATDLTSIATTSLGYRMQDVISMSDVPNLTILMANAAVETTLRAQPRQTFTFTPKPYAPGIFTLRPFIDYDLGDIIYVSAKRGRVNVSSQAQRVFGIDIAIDESGVERVTNISTSPSA